MFTEKAELSPPKVPKLEGIIDNSVEDGVAVHPGNSESEKKPKHEVKKKETGVSSSIVPVDALPEEVWVDLFNTLSLSDLRSCFRTAPQWRTWLKSKRTMLLFKEVAPLILENLPKNELLNCRQVSQAWMEGLDDAYQSHPTHVRFLPDYDYPERVVPDLSILLSVKNLEEFLEEMDTHPGNPFIGRNATFSTLNYLVWKEEDPIEEIDEGSRRSYWNNVARLLEKFGSQLHSVELDFEDDDYSVLPKMEAYIRNILLCIPNIKMLTIDCSAPLRTEIPNFFTENPMPLLPDLEALEIRPWSPAFLSAVLESCCVPTKIKRLHIRDRHGHREPLSILWSFSNLEYLDGSFLVEDLEAFRNLPKPPPLVDISLFLCDVPFMRGPDFVRVFTALEVFGGSLRYLQLHRTPLEFDTDLRLGTPNSFRVNLPNLEGLSLPQYKGPMDPFLQLESLAYFWVTIADGSQSWEGSVVSFHGFENRMYDSNIWTLMPSLKELTVRTSQGGWSEKVYERAVLENKRNVEEIKKLGCQYLNYIVS